MYQHVKKLMYTVRVDAPDPRFGNMLLEQFGGARPEDLDADAEQQKSRQAHDDGRAGRADGAAGDEEARAGEQAGLDRGLETPVGATGVTDGALMKGVRFFGDGTRTTSLIMQTNPHRIRFIDSIQVQQGVAKIRF